MEDNAKPGELMPDEIWIESYEGKRTVYTNDLYPSSAVKYTRAPQNPPVQRDEIREAVETFTALLDNPPHGLGPETEKRIRVLIRAAVQRVAPQTGVMVEVLNRALSMSSGARKDKYIHNAIDLLTAQKEA